MPMPRHSPLDRELLAAIQRQFRLDITGVHGLPHWGRVRWNGRLLARESGADIHVVDLFAVFHDACRFDDGYDPDHGARGAELAARLRGRLFALDDERFGWLQAACRGHSDGHTEANPTVMTCWDADRLDLGRVGMRPNPRYLCTAAARRQAIIEACWRRSLR